MASVSDGYGLLSHKGTVWKPVGEATLAGYAATVQRHGACNRGKHSDFEMEFMV
ncbi:MAG: hypothetical protein NC407_08100 [Lachnoclostridium sp.]|nr:hypothetical protein [Lachnoclostridium sp.]